MDVLDINTYSSLLNKFLDWLSVSGFRIAVILIAAYILRRIVLMVIRRIFKVAQYCSKTDSEAIKRLTTLQRFIHLAATTVIGAVTIIVILQECGIEIGPILAAAGVFGLAVSFGAQHLVQDVISGFFILYDNQFREGDTITTNNMTGTVERMNLRLVVLRAADGSLHYIRSGQLGPITNQTRDYSYYVFELGVAYDSDLDQAFKAINEVSEQMLHDPVIKDNLLEPFEILGLDRFDASSLTIKGRVRTKPQMQWVAGRHFNFKIKKAFDEAGINMPIPQQTIHIDMPPK